MACEKRTDVGVCGQTTTKPSQSSYDTGRSCVPSHVANCTDMSRVP